MFGGGGKKRRLTHLLPPTSPLHSYRLVVGFVSVVGYREVEEEGVRYEGVMTRGDGQ